MRKFAENYMIRCGLAEKFVYAITSHASKMGATSHYLDWDEIGNSWYEICSDRMTWLQEIQRIVEADPRTEKRLREVEEQLAGFKELGKILGDKRLTLEERVQTLLKVLKQPAQIEEKSSVEKPVAGALRSALHLFYQKLGIVLLW